MVSRHIALVPDTESVERAEPEPDDGQDYAWVDGAELQEVAVPGAVTADPALSVPPPLRLALAVAEVAAPKPIASAARLPFSGAWIGALVLLVGGTLGWTLMQGRLAPARPPVLAARASPPIVPSVRGLAAPAPPASAAPIPANAVPAPSSLSTDIPTSPSTAAPRHLHARRSQPRAHPVVVPPADLPEPAAPTEPEPEPVRAEPSAPPAVVAVSLDALIESRR